MNRSFITVSFFILAITAKAQEKPIPLYNGVAPGSEKWTWDEKTIGSFDAILICTAHDNVDHSKIALWSDCIVDTRNAMKGVAGKPGQIWKA